MGNNHFLCGAAIRDITPTRENGILPMPCGFSASVRELTCVHDPLYVRVIALKDEQTTVLLVSMDIVNMEAQLFGPALSEHTGIPQEAIFLIETTAHSTIRAGAQARNGTDPEGLRKLKQYTDIIMGQLFHAAEEALANMRPAKIGIGRAESYVNVNRDTIFTAEDETGIHEFCDIAFNPAGTSDRTVAVLRFEDEEGNPIAFFINYAIFNVLMDDNAAGENGTGAISADLAGYVSTHVENRYQGAVAMWCGGANCDQDPIMKAKLHYPDPDHGGRATAYLSPEACDTVLTCIGETNYADTLKAIESVKETKGNAVIRYAYDCMTIPGRTQTVERRQGSNFVKLKYGAGKEYRIGLTVLRIGDIAIAFHGGSIYSSIGMYMKQESILKDTLIATGYVNAATPFDGAICDDSAIARGGHDANRIKYRPGFVKNALTLLMNQLIVKTEWQPYSAETRKWEKK